MTTAREQAHEAALDACLYLDDNIISVAADAACDVWEPIVRNLLLDIEFCGERSSIWSLKGQAGYKAAKEALDG